jgi:LPS export ABC transporter protein LptC
MKKSLLVIFSILLFCLFFYLVRDEKEVKLQVRQSGNSFIEGLRIVNRKDGSADWMLTARRADISEDGQMAYLTDVGMSLEKKGLTLHTDKGVYNMAQRTLAAEGKTVATGKDYSVTAGRVQFDGRNQKMTSRENVVIESKKFTITGRNMDVDNVAQTMRIDGDVKATFYR